MNHEVITNALNEFIDEIKLTSRPLDIKISTEF